METPTSESWYSIKPTGGSTTGVSVGGWIAGVGLGCARGGSWVGPGRYWVGDVALIERQDWTRIILSTRQVMRYLLVFLKVFFLVNIISSFFLSCSD